MTTLWVSDTTREAAGNHHAPAAGRVDGETMVYAPVSGRTNTSDCALVALNGTTGSKRWSDPIPATNCTIHSVADPTLADFDSDGTKEVIAATTEQTVTAYHPLTGAVEFSHNLTSYGYTKPIVGDFVSDSRPEIVVVDVSGTVFVFRPNGTTVWSTRLSSYTWGQPAIDDFDGDGVAELAVATGGSGRLTLFESNGSMSWKRSPSYDGSITWMTTGNGDDDDAVEIVIATASTGFVSMVDGRTGEREWTRDFGAFAAVHAMADADADGTVEIYAAAKDGVLRSLDADTGRTEWTTTLSTGEVQMMPPPSLGDLDGDGTKELLAVTNDGRVSVVDPGSGEVLGTYERKSSIFTHPTIADLDRDGDDEALVMYGDGRVVALDFN
jgi:outer membrane protein assembly factor BamB